MPQYPRCRLKATARGKNLAIRGGQVFSRAALVILGLRDNDAGCFGRRRNGFGQNPLMAIAGVVITEIERRSSAAEAGLLEGDLISGINLQRITSVKDFTKVIKKIDTSDGVVFDIVRKGKRFYFSFSTE